LALAAARQRLIFSALRAGDLLRLQRTVGNRTTAHLIARPPDIGAPLTTATIRRKIEAGKLNIVGESHDKSDHRRAREKEMLKSFGPYWEEDEFSYEVGDQTKHGDSLEHLVIQSLMFLSTNIQLLESRVQIAVMGPVDDQNTVLQIDRDEVEKIQQSIDAALDETDQLRLAVKRLERSEAANDELIDAAREKWMDFERSLEDYRDDIEDAKENPEDMRQTLQKLPVSAGVWRDGIQRLLAAHGYDLSTFIPSPDGKNPAIEQAKKVVVGERSLHMWVSAVEAAEQGHVRGVWMVGDEHVRDDLRGETHPGVTLTTAEAFTKEYDAWYPIDETRATGPGDSSQATTRQG
jgi:hypothetical protein